MDKEKDKSVGTKMGQFVANVFVTCIGLCLSACIVALAMRFILWLF